ncbi:Uncharacterised protein [Raoultella ornithinolytica]|nr:Uncharacterised protein [Raoultella ornithinolytica]
MTVVAGAGAAGTGDARRVRLIGHDFRTTGLDLRNRGDIELNAADIEVFHPGALAVVVHPEVVVDPLLWTLVEVTTGPDIGAGIGCQHVGDANIGLLEVNFVAPVVEHHVDIPDGALAALKGFGNLELAAVAFVTQTTNRRGAVIGTIDADVLLIAGLEMGAVAGVAAKLQTERNRHIRRSGGGLRVGFQIHLPGGGGVHFRLAVSQRLIDGFRHNGVNLFLSKFLGHNRGKRAKRGDNRHR